MITKIIQDVKLNGDKAIKKYTLKFDKIKLTNIKVAPSQIKSAYLNVDAYFIEALKIAKKNIDKFNENILIKKERTIETSAGVKCWREFRPIEKIGLYVPGGLATYPSTVLMLGVPAKIAGCTKIVLCSPPPISDAILVAADIVGITEIFQVGGAQAIAAMTYGTKCVPRVQKIFGPGNKYVMQAKMLVSQDVAIDMPAGPSEIAILADETANPKFIQADLASQLEHGPDTKAWLITTNQNLYKKIKIGKKILIKNINAGIKKINELAPEHLEIIVKNEKQVIAKIVNAGSVFIGSYSPVPAGDYITGPNHTLPTSSWAKVYSALSVEDFGKMVEFQKVSEPGLSGLKDYIIKLAETEGLPKHAEAIKIRFKND
ncbi:MAG: histidinol dehydrogenase [Patescibacteria group bacterium]